MPHPVQYSLPQKVVLRKVPSFTMASTLSSNAVLLIFPPNFSFFPSQTFFFRLLTSSFFPHNPLAHFFLHILLFATHNPFTKLFLLRTQSPYQTSPSFYTILPSKSSFFPASFQPTFSLFPCNPSAHFLLLPTQSLTRIMYFLFPTQSLPQNTSFSRPILLSFSHLILPLTSQ